MAALSSKLLPFGRFERNKLTTRWNLQPAFLQAVSSISFLSRSKDKKKSLEKDSEGRILVDPDVVVDTDDKHLVHKEQPLVLVEEKRVYTEEEIETIRNKSRLRDPDLRLLRGMQPYTSPKFWTHKTVKYQRRMFARYGEETGINPGICWPLASELKIRLEYESVDQPFTFHELVDKVKARKKAEQDEIERRAKEVEANMAKAEKAKDDYLARVGLKEKDAREAMDRKEKLMDEVRRHFGFKIDVRDEKFQEMLEKKEREQRKVKKEARKLARAQEQLRKLSEMGQQVKSSTDTAEAPEAQSEVDAKPEAKTKKEKEEVEEDSDDEDKPTKGKGKK